jgi:hypothetical protein
MVSPFISAANKMIKPIILFVSRACMDIQSFFYFMAFMFNSFFQILLELEFVVLFTFKNLSLSIPGN